MVLQHTKEADDNINANEHYIEEDPGKMAAGSHKKSQSNQKVKPTRHGHHLQ